MSVGLENEADRRDDPRPVFLFRRQLFQPGAGDAVVPGAPSFRCFAPLTLDEPPLFEPVERREERSRLDDKGVSADLADAVRDTDAVPRLQPQRFQNEEIERALEEIRLLCHAADYTT